MSRSYPTSRKRPVPKRSLETATTSFPGPVRERRLCRWLVRLGVLGVGLLTGAALADARDGPPPGDWQLALQARHALWGEPPFDKLNLGVSVRDGVAIVS